MAEQTCDEEEEIKVSGDPVTLTPLRVWLLEHKAFIQNPIKVEPSSDLNLAWSMANIRWARRNKFGWTVSYWNSGSIAWFPESSFRFADEQPNAC